VKKRPLQLPLRLRLTLWYTFSLGIILLLFTAFVYIQASRSLMNQIDAALRLAANQALLNVAPAGGRLQLQTTTQNTSSSRHFSDDFVIHLLAQDETILDIISVEDEPPSFSSQAPGFETQWNDGDPWRVYRQTVDIDDQSGWIQVAQELEPLNNTLASLRTQILWGLPLALILAGVGGYFLASRALRPIDRITQTAQAINASDMHERIHFDGPADEVGRLAETFDTMLDRLQTAFERERRFTADAAHELRTPLAALKGRIGVTLSQQRRPQTYIDTLQDMEKQVDRLIRLSNDLLFMARIDQGQLVPQMEKIDGVDFLDAVVDQIRPLAALKSITIQETFAPHLFLNGDIDLLIRLFLNLLDNAVKYTPENGRVSIQATTDIAAVRVAISDTGPGIAPEALPHLFERFYRAESDRTRQSTDNNLGGAGLGLGIAYEIARLHHGSLTVQSELGQGATFTVQLPKPDQTQAQHKSHS